MRDQNVIGDKKGNLILFVTLISSYANVNFMIPLLRRRRRTAHF